MDIPPESFSTLEKPIRFFETFYEHFDSWRTKLLSIDSPALEPKNSAEEKLFGVSEFIRLLSDQVNKSKNLIENAILRSNSVESAKVFVTMNTGKLRRIYVFHKANKEKFFECEEFLKSTKALLFIYGELGEFAPALEPSPSELIEKPNYNIGHKRKILHPKFYGELASLPMNFKNTFWIILKNQRKIY